MKKLIKEQLENMKQEHPELLNSEIKLPQFDENDEIITKEENKDEQRN